jgi:hypothetical protein
VYQEIEIEESAIYEARKDALADQAYKNVNEGKSFAKLVIGNLYDSIEDPRLYADNKVDSKLAKRWCMFLTLDDDKEKTEKFIESVRYFLHPSYK